ncbi:MAG: DUF692 family protein [Alphaproteobacteria bacterium]|nr:DUF692 family protein [Alphaproteobacteria bacterium]
MGRVGLGFTFQPDPDWLELCAPCFALADVVECSPETLWVPDGEPGVRPNGYFRLLQDLQQRRGIPVVAHGIALSMGSTLPDDARRAAWLERVAKVHETFRFDWYTDHFGATWYGDRHLTVPLPLAPVRPVLDGLRARLREMSQVVPLVGMENSAFPFALGTPEEEADLLCAAIGEEHVQVLDVHNLWLAVEDQGLDVDAWLARAPLHRVVEIHVSGGSVSDPRWLPSRRVLRLDSHDHEVPDPVLALLAKVVPRCPMLRVVVLERLEHTVTPEDVPELVATMHAVRQILDRAPPPVAEPRSPGLLPEVDAEVLLRFEQGLADALLAADPQAALAALVAPPPLDRALAAARAHPEGFHIAALLVAKTRFERVVQGSRAAADWFERDPATFTQVFRTYHEEQRPTAVIPLDEARQFVRWTRLAADVAK